MKCTRHLKLGWAMRAWQLCIPYRPKAVYLLTLILFSENKSRNSGFNTGSKYRTYEKSILPGDYGQKKTSDNWGNVFYKQLIQRIKRRTERSLENPKYSKENLKQKQVNNINLHFPTLTNRTLKDGFSADMLTYNTITGLKTKKLRYILFN